MAVYINNRQFTACENGQENSMCLPKLFRNSDTGLATSNYVSNPPYNKRLFSRVFKDPINKNFTMCPDGWKNCNKEECPVSNEKQDPANLCMNNNDEFCKPLTTFTTTDSTLKPSPCVYNNNDNILVNNAPGIHDYTDPQDCLNACEKIIDRDLLYSSSKSNINYKKNCWGVSAKVDDKGKTVCQYLNDFPTNDSLNDSNLSKLHIRNYRPYNLPNSNDLNSKNIFLDLGITSESLQKYNKDPSKSTLFNLYNINPHGAGPDGKKKNSKDDFPIFNNPSIPQSKSNVIQYSEDIGPSFTGPFDKGTIDSSSGTALMDYLSNEHFVNKCGSILCDNYRGFTTASIFIIIITIFLFRYINK
jgi:hypothetical protein